MDNDGELVFAAPSYVGEIAERARRVEELERKNDYLFGRALRLEAVIAKKDEHIQKVADLILQTKSIWPHMSSILDTMYFWVINALSLTPASVAKEVEDARVGRAVVEWQQRKDAEWRGKQKCSGLDHYVDAYIEALGELEKVIAKAREGKA